jgi:hypothetical protein
MTHLPSALSQTEAMMGKEEEAINLAELFPEGRHIFYEGDDPAGFIKEMKERYGLEVTVSLDCPAKLLNEIYRSGKYPMGS